MNEEKHWREPQREDFESRPRRTAAIRRGKNLSDVRKLEKEDESSWWSALAINRWLLLLMCPIALGAGFYVGETRSVEAAKLLAERSRDAEQRIAQAESVANAAIASRKTAEDRAAQAGKERDVALAEKKAAEDRATQAGKDQADAIAAQKRAENDSKARQATIDDLNRRINILQKKGGNWNPSTD